MGYWGTQFNRNLTWWNFSRVWFEYLARCQYMLHIGKQYFSALSYPIAYDSKMSSPITDYRYALLTDELLFGAMVKDGKIILPTGTEFEVLYLNKRPITPEALEKIKGLVMEGATLAGYPPPRHSSSLKNFPECDKRVYELIDSIWGKDFKNKNSGKIKLGKGMVVYGKNLPSCMEELGVLPDFMYEGKDEKRPTVVGVLRIDGEKKFWFITNNQDEEVSIEGNFAVSGMQPELWNPVNGKVRRLDNFEIRGGRTIIPLKFYSRESYFIVFREKAKSDIGEGINFLELRTVEMIKGKWSLKFDSKWGGPSEDVIFDTLTDWSKSEDNRIKYYSGTVQYKTSFRKPVVGDDSILYLNIGQVYNIARVRINGTDLGTIWCAPWQVEIPKGILKDENILEIDVANTWVNRLIGDEQEPMDFEVITLNREKGRQGGYAKDKKGRGLKDLPDWLINRTPRLSKGRYTFSSWLYYDKDAPLQKSGLLGDVKILSTQ